MLLERPGWNDNVRFTESVCDKDGFLANVWRSIQFNPDEVVKWCDWPVNHADLSARKKELIKNEDRLLDNLINNPEWYDAKLAGYWIWAASCWIGSGLTQIGQIPHITNAGMGINSIGKRPHIGDAGTGIHSIGKIPHIGHAGKGINSIGKIPHISKAGMGINSIGQIPHICNAGMGINANNNIHEWINTLSKRLRYVRVVCGDWTRVCGGNWQDKIGIAGIFFDPPYGVSDRCKSIYHHDSVDLAKDVMSWCKERGKIKSYRIVIAGYEEYKELLEEGWTSESWSAQGGYAHIGKSKVNENRHRETLYYSPCCIRNIQKKLF